MDLAEKQRKGAWSEMRRTKKAACYGNCPAQMLEEHFTFPPCSWSSRIYCAKKWISI